jgi:hypothetical protein
VRVCIRIHHMGCQSMGVTVRVQQPIGRCCYAAADTPKYTKIHKDTSLQKQAGR